MTKQKNKRQEEKNSRRTDDGWLIQPIKSSMLSFSIEIFRNLRRWNFNWVLLYFFFSLFSLKERRQNGGERFHQLTSSLCRSRRREKQVSMDRCTENIGNASCPKCFYGPHCQFTTHYFTLTSLDTYLCSMGSLSLIFLMILFIFGSVMNLLTIGTFSRAVTREMGTGIYRLWLGIIGQTCLTIVLLDLTLKKHQQWIGLTCYVFEYLRKFLHSLYDSLTACTSLERTIVISHGIAFNKAGSRRVAKVVIPILICYHSLMILYEPFYRQLKSVNGREWCTLKFSHHFWENHYSLMNLLHVFTPYLINLISPITWLITLTQQKSRLNTNLSRWTHSLKVMWSYKFTFISCLSLVLLNTPRLISTWFFTCIQSVGEHDFYIISYFLSLMPMVCNLVLFVLPSPKYRPELFRLIRIRPNSNVL